MSSRTSAGKKKVKRLQTDSASVQVKPQVVKVEFIPPPPQVIELKRNEESREISSTKQIKLQGIKWEVLVQSTLVATIGTAVLFMIGWAYISNWYVFFGVGLENINIPLQQVLVYSSSPIIHFLTAFGSGYYLYIILRGFTKFASRRLSADDWAIVIILSIIIMLLFDYRFSWRELSQVYFETLLIPSELRFLYLLLGGIIMIVLSQIVISLLALIRKGLLGFKRINALYWGWIKNALWKWFVISFVVLIALMGDAAIGAYFDASHGIKGVGGLIHRVLLTSQKPLGTLSSVELSCTADVNCIYGPFGLIHETDDTFYLVSWEQKDENPFFLNRRLYILPRGDQNGPFFIIPDSISSTTSTVIPTTPTPIVIESPTITQP